jgi:hypothetical protein
MAGNVGNRSLRVAERIAMRTVIFFDRKGFTLVEAIVSGALTIFVLLTAMTLYKMNADQIRGAFLSCLTRMQYQTVIDKIASDARQATVITSFKNATATATTFDTVFMDTDADSVYFFDISATVPRGRYCRGHDTLYEWSAAGNRFIPFKIGNDTVHVVNDGIQRAFTIAGDKKSVRLNLGVFGIDGSLKDTVFSKGERFTCRN